MSSTYFITNLENMFVENQFVDVWVKFCSQNPLKIGFQSFPLKDIDPSSVKIPTRKLVDLIPKSPISGIVQRFGEYGVHVNIGAEVEAYLPLRKSKISKKLRNLTPYEVFNIGNWIEGYVYRLDVSKKRVEITTYPPLEWEKQFATLSQYPNNKKSFLSSMEYGTAEVNRDEDRGGGRDRGLSRKEEEEGDGDDTGAKDGGTGGKTRQEGARVGGYTDPDAIKASLSDVSGYARALLDDLRTRRKRRDEECWSTEDVQEGEGLRQGQKGEGIRGSWRGTGKWRSKKR